VLPPTADGDILVIHDTGARGHAMGFTYNGKLRPKLLLLRSDGGVGLVRNEESLEDYFATLSFEPNVL
jgi:diaminopimelate decarboxylase